MSYVDNEGFFAAPDDTIDWPTADFSRRFGGPPWEFAKAGEGEDDDEPCGCLCDGLALTVAGVISAAFIVLFATLLLVA